MPKEVKGGSVYRKDQTEKLAAGVDHIDFPPWARTRRYRPGPKGLWS
jgi:hypothetical protein